jgi:hypothetical protein
MNNSAFINYVSFLNVETPCNRTLVSFQKQIGKDQVAGRTADIDTNGKYFYFVYFHDSKGSGFKVHRSGFPVELLTIILNVHLIHSNFKSLVFGQTDPIRVLLQFRNPEPLNAEPEPLF